MTSASGKPSRTLVTSFPSILGLCSLINFYRWIDCPLLGTRLPWNPSMRWCINSLPGTTTNTDCFFPLVFHFRNPLFVGTIIIVFATGNGIAVPARIRWCWCTVLQELAMRCNVLSLHYCIRGTYRLYSVLQPVRTN